MVSVLPFFDMIHEAVFAGGCFWGLEDLLRSLPGVLDTEVGYTGGKNENPTYEFHPGHAEAVCVTYDDTLTSYEKLLDWFFCVHNPTTSNQQGNDVGTSYRSAIFYKTEDEKGSAKKIIELVDTSERWSDSVVTTLEPFTTFYPAENHHQNYLLKNPEGYTCHAVYFKSYLPD